MNITNIANDVVKDVQTKKYQNAAKKIRFLLDSNADIKENWGGITRLALTIGEFKQAKEASQKFLNVGPHEPKRIIQCAAILAEMREVDSAISLVKPLLDQNRTPEVLHFLGTTYAQIGQIELAKKYLVELLNIAPNSAISWLTLSAIHKFKDDDALFSKLSANKNQENQPAPYWFALGKAYLDLNDEKSAFLSFKKGNMHMKNNKYIASQHQAFVDGIIKTQNQSFSENVHSLEQDEKVDPLFIIGVPRSGTTLLQQILSTHTQLNDGGELMYLSYPIIEIGQQNIRNLNSMNKEQQKDLLQKVRSDYFERLQQQFDTKHPCIDKTLNLNHHIGLISKSFPNAPIIRVVRDVKDTAWSCYRAFFNQGTFWSYDLENIAEYFYHENRLANHWAEIYKDRIIEVSYEDLVNKPEETLTKCLKPIGLSFETDMLSFYKKAGLVQTSSVGQVRNPINTNSINQAITIEKELAPFSNHYTNLLEQK